jgi:hypothetical protein
MSVNRLFSRSQEVALIGIGTFLRVAGAWIAQGGLLGMTGMSDAAGTAVITLANIPASAPTLTAIPIFAPDAGDASRVIGDWTVEAVGTVIVDVFDSATGAADAFADGDRMTLILAKSADLDLNTQHPGRTQSSFERLP